MSSPFNPADIREDAWVVIEVTPHYIKSRAHVSGDTYVERTEHIDDDALFEMNQAQRDANDSTRWGTGKVAARIPLNKYFEQGGLAENIKKGNDDHTRWWLNREENRPFRTKRGVI